MCTAEKKIVDLFFDSMQNQKDPILSNAKGRIIFDKIKANIKNRKSTWRTRNLLKAAAAILITAIGLGIGIGSLEETVPEITEIAAKGKKEK